MKINLPTCSAHLCSAEPRLHPAFDRLLLTSRSDRRPFTACHLQLLTAASVSPSPPIAALLRPTLLRFTDPAWAWAGVPVAGPKPASAPRGAVKRRMRVASPTAHTAKDSSGGTCLGDAAVPWLGGAPDWAGEGGWRPLLSRTCRTSAKRGLCPASSRACTKADNSGTGLRGGGCRCGVRVCP